MRVAAAIRRHAASRRRLPSSELAVMGGMRLRFLSAVFSRHCRRSLTIFWGQVQPSFHKCLPSGNQPLEAPSKPKMGPASQSLSLFTMSHTSLGRE